MGALQIYIDDDDDDLYCAAFAHMLPSAALSSQTGPAFRQGRICPSPCSRTCAAIQPHVAPVCRL